MKTHFSHHWIADESWDIKSNMAKKTKNKIPTRPVAFIHILKIASKHDLKPSKASTEQEKRHVTLTEPVGEQQTTKATQ